MCLNRRMLRIPDKVCEQRGHFKENRNGKETDVNNQKAFIKAGHATNQGRTVGNCAENQFINPSIRRRHSSFQSLTPHSIIALKGSIIPIA